jgi:hypothetical protein
MTALIAARCGSSSAGEFGDEGGKEVGGGGAGGGELRFQRVQLMKRNTVAAGPNLPSDG